MIYLIFIFVNIVSLYLMIILLSFDPIDPSWMQSTWDGSIHNWGGIIGSKIADFLFFYFGSISYIIPMFISYYFWNFLFKTSEIYIFNIFSRLFMLLISLFVCCTLAHLSFNDIFYFSSGGVIGNILLDFLKNDPYTLLFVGAIFLCSKWISQFYLFNKSFIFFIKTTQKKIKNYLLTTFITFFKKKQCFYINKKLYFNRRIFPSIFCTQKNIVLNKKIIKSLCTNNKLKISSNAVEYLKQSNFYSKINTDTISFIVPPCNNAAIFHYNNNSIHHPDCKAKLYSNHNTTSHHIIKSVYNTTFKNKKPINSFNKHIKKNLLNTATNINAYLELKKNNVTPFDNTDKLRVEINNLFIQQKPIFIKKNLNDPQFMSTKNNRNILERSNTKCFQKNNDFSKFILPNLNLLTTNVQKNIVLHVNHQKISQLIEQKLLEYRITANVAKIVTGPVITRFELNLSPGIKSSKISGLSRDLARALSVASVQVIEVIPGTPYVGLEIPNRQRYIVYLQDIICSNKFKNFNSPLALVLGQDITGKPVIKDLRHMPHLLIAGTTGSGKSIGINAMIISILYTATPEDVRFIMIDPKILELSVYSGIPHLLTTVITDTQDTESVLQWCVQEMENRYKLMSVLSVRNIESYNSCIQETIIKNNKSNCSIRLLVEEKINNLTCCVSQESKKLPYIVVIIDEFSDLILMSTKKVEVLITRLTQKARASGIHIILSTQRPSVDVITGVIKANIPARIAFTVSSKIDSRTILGQSGAESLLGMGDMLYLPPNSSNLIRIHGAHITDQEIQAVVKFWRNQIMYIKSLYKIKNV